MSVWNKFTQDRENSNELYSNVANLYHEYRPRYPAQLMDTATATLSPGATILEIGCGPGTATLPLLQRGFRVVCVEPGSGMIAKARQECQEYSRQVTFHHSTLQEYLERQHDSSDDKFDAILAATSFHWALDSRGEIVRRLHALLKPNGKLLLLWNIPPEPTARIRDAVATAISKAIPFYFGGYSTEQHVGHIQNEILSVVESTNLFTAFDTRHYPTRSHNVPIDEYLGMVRTFSYYIKLQPDERESFMQSTGDFIKKFCGNEGMETEGLSILNVAAKVDKADSLRFEVNSSGTD